MSLAGLFKASLNMMLLEAARARMESVEITAADLRNRLPTLRPEMGDQIPVCYQVMWATLSLDVGDTILEDPPAGQAASLRIRYVLPRPEWH